MALNLPKFLRAWLGYLAASAVYGCVALPAVIWSSHHPRRQMLASAIVYWLVASAVYAIVRAWKSHRKQLFALIFSALFCLLFLEAGIRFLAPELALMSYQGLGSKSHHHQMPPNRVMLIGQVGGDLVTVRTNEDGFRTPYSREEFLKFKHRIVLLGDSFTFGLNVKEEFILATRLEKLLRERLKTDDLAVLNTGTISYSPFLQKLRFEGEIRHYKPTLTLLYLDATDIGDDQSYMEEYRIADAEKQSGEFYDRARTIRYYGAVIERFFIPVVLRPLARPWKVWFPDKPRAGDNWYHFRLQIDGDTAMSRWFILKFPPEKTRPYFDDTMRNIEDVAKMASEIESKFVLMVTPRFFLWSDRECPENLEGAGYRRNEPYRNALQDYFVKEKAGKVGFPIFDMLPAFQATQEFPLVFPADPHWNANGNDFVARTTADYLIEQRLLP